MLAQLGDAWHCRPSEFIRGLPEVTALQIDAAAFVRLNESRREIAERPEERQGRDIYL
jgi:hypothetical protein